MITTTLNRIRAHGPCQDGWVKQMDCYSRGLDCYRRRPGRQDGDQPITTPLRPSQAA
jgi:hypothetical protein